MTGAVESREERLLDLVIALNASRRPMTRAHIRRTVAGYGDAPSDEAFAKLFERDKQVLRDLGVPLVTVGTGGYGDDIGYRIDADAYALPPIRLSPGEMGVLSVAARLWSDTVLGGDTARAVTKLRSATRVNSFDDMLAGLSPRISAAGPTYQPLLDAITQRRRVSFNYRAASTGEVARRRIEPWRIVARRGGWYAIGYDCDRGQPRAFRLSRIDGEVDLDAARNSYQPPSHVDVDAALALDGGQEGQAQLAIMPERASAVRARAVDTDAAGDGVAGSGDAVEGGDTGGNGVADGRDVVIVPFTSLTVFADELAAYGPAVIVMSPDDLRQAVIDRLTAAAALEVTRG
ncbi:MAG: WYL domain-containing protein [Cellulomonadaceae bacterium]|jgi:proteasome accessory factor B|nr:WYL domain-containing protein [Cellulomonadaceae bacterium]